MHIDGCDWDINWNTTPILFPYVDEGTEILEKWVQVFRPEETWVQREFRIPSLIVRLDATVVDGRLACYEVEERPAGIGVGTVLDEGFRLRLEQVKMTWPDFRVVVSAARGGRNDDHLWCKTTHQPEIPDDGLLFIRAEPEERWVHALHGRAVSTVLRKGDKSYGEKLGWWRQIRVQEREDLDDLPWGEGFVLKPLQSSKARDICVWDPRGRSKRLPGSFSESQIEAMALRLGFMYVQPLLHPFKGPAGPTIFRVFYGYDVNARGWVCLGGLWNSRNNWRIHGSSDSVFGPSTLP